MKNEINNLALTGAGAAAEALKQINPDVLAVYPITPQTPIIENYSQMKADGEVDTEIIHVESEHSALSACVGASAAGGRTITATSSQGLALMHEILYVASGLRLPILMLVSARALSAPLNIHGDHSDVMGARDAGWIQLFCQNSQEVYDQTIIGLKLAEKSGLPVMVIMDGFITSHSVENLEILEKEKVKKFMGEYHPQNSLLDLKNPVTFGSLALPNVYFEFKIDQEKAMREVLKNYSEIASEYEKISGRKYGPVEKYRTEDAENVLVMMGSSAGTAKDAVDKLRKENKKVGLLKINLFRPFPDEEIAAVLKNVSRVSVWDRAQSIGTKPPLYMEIINAAENCQPSGLPENQEIRSCLYGLGGRDLFQKQIEAVLNENDISRNEINYIF